MAKILTVVLTLLSKPALAQDIFPALHDVTGVAAGDVLNVRAAPSAGAEIIGSLGPFETVVEVIGLSDDGRWGRVNAGEQSGWASMRYLARQPGQTAADWSVGLAPMTLDCFGTEPFWGLSLFPGGAFEFTDPFQGDGTALSGSYKKLSSSASTGKRGFIGSTDSDPAWFGVYAGVINSELCSDGMSDMLYGLALDLLRNDQSGDRLDAGCCRLAP